MENNITSSFIPSDATTFASRTPGGSALYDVLLLVSIVLLVASSALAGGVFLYSQYLTAQVDAKKQQVERARKAFNPALMQDITRLDERMRAGDVVLRAHHALSGFFRFLEITTLENVAFSTLQLDAKDVNAVEIKMSGLAKSVNSIALQADVFSKGGALSSPLFSNIARREGGVQFDLAATINADLIKYNNVHVNNQNAFVPADTVNQGAPASSEFPL